MQLAAVGLTVLGLSECDCKRVVDPSTNMKYVDVWMSQ